MFTKIAFTIFAGGVLAYFVLPDQEAGFRMLGFSTAFLILAVATACVIAFLNRLVVRSRFSAPLQRSRVDDGLSSRNTVKADWSTSGVNPSDPNQVWQYRLND